MPPFGHSLNLCNHPPWALASRHFNDEPRAIEIQGVRRAHRHLFRRLAAEDDAGRRAQVFQEYVDVAFQLHHWWSETSSLGRRSLKNSYLRFLRGWMVDSNSVEGAVLKGWVESRLGLPPTFHREAIRDLAGEAYFRYTVDRMRGQAHTNAIHAQLDVLFEFVQSELVRREPLTTHQTLYRGVFDLSEHEILEELAPGRLVLRLNSLNSFTRDFERAWEFGTRVLEVNVPIPKVFFRADLLATPILTGEEEVLVIGGAYEVAVRTF
ncbi:MAG: NAD(+)--dinitrogen-reductase ADP-D-ribosyltransferase [Deltaproteobacteria bacterium]|nr:NAD(+)--dinitrogen-reductase ADP-D-ribosyltransferase [Deltaproteobacteria bacterium]